MRRQAGAADGQQALIDGFVRPDDGAYPLIGDYASIGDGRSVALVSRDASIDWLCLPHFSSPSLFAAILDRHRGGRFAVRPTGPFRTSRRYVDDTNVLETTFDTATGRITVTDCLTLLPAGKHHDDLRPQAEIIRVVRGCGGSVEVEMICAPRANYARSRGRFENRGKLGWAYCWSDQVSFLQADFALDRQDDECVTARFRIAEGETACVSFAFTRRDIAVVPTLGEDAHGRVQETLDWWRGWTADCPFEGTDRDAVVRSALVLKQLDYSLSGAVVAAPTTSLPEVVGGVRNWDYRFCWLRDAAMTFEAFVGLGYAREAEFFIDWLLHATRLSRPRLNVMYDIFGERRLPEYELDHLEGYRRSRPVRIGNDAHAQVQLDVYGSVIQTAYDYVRSGGALEFSEARALAGFGRSVCKLWQQPDEGIWEARVDPKHHTYSKMMCWVALDRLVALHDGGHVRIPVERFTAARDAIREAIEEHGFSTRLGSYVGWFGGDAPDASLLLAARYGYIDATHPRMHGTYEHLKAELGHGALIYRYPPGADGLPGREGAFGIASFWAVEYLALAGRVAEARACFDALCAHGNDLGLYGEEIDVETGAALGNYPQAFTHVGLINAALALREAERHGQASTWSE